MNIANMKVTLTLEALVIIALTLAGGVSTAVYGYFRLDAKATAGVAANESIEAMRCDIRQLKMFMVYGVKPSAIDHCP